MSNFNQYSWFNTKRTELATLLQESATVIKDLSMPQFSGNLKKLSQKVHSDTFKIQLVGTFKNGKSTFINALLGEDILPTRSLPCTAVVSEVKYGDTKKAILHFRNPLPDKLIDCIPDATLNHMRKHGMKNVPPMEIEYDRIDDYVTIPIDGDPEEISMMSPYMAVELFYPSPLLKEGVEIIDSPGLNEADERTRVTLEYLDKADAIIVLLDATKLCSKDEIETIESILLAKGFNDMFFVVNRIDLIPARERGDVEKFAKAKLNGYSKNDIYYISALQAVDAKIEGDDTKYINSGMKAFEDRLTVFLTKDKGRIKLVQPARELNNILSTEALYKNIPRQRKELSLDLQKLEENYKKAKPQLDDLKIKKSQLSEKLHLRIEQSGVYIRRALLSYFKELTNKVPAWVKEYQPKEGVGFASRSKIEKLSKDISNYVTDKIKKDSAAWTTEVLRPLIDEKATEIFEYGEEELKKLYISIDEVNAMLSGLSIDVQTAKGWERALGVATLCLGSASGAYMMVNGFHFKDIVKTIAIDFGVGTTLLILGLTNPVIAIAAAAGVVWKAVAIGQSQAVQGAKDAVTKQICDAINSKSSIQAEDMAKNIMSELNKFADNALSGIDTEISDIQSRVNDILATKKKGKAHVESRKKLIDACEEKIQAICGKLDALVFELAGMN